MNNLRSILAIDIAVLAATLLAAGWLVSHTDLEIEKSLGLESSQWLHDAESDSETTQRALANRKAYAERFPGSPIARLNGIPGMYEVERAIETWFERCLPSLAAVGMGLAIVAVRSPGRCRRGSRWGPGRVSAAISLIVTTALLVPEFLLRRFNLIKYGDLHATIDYPVADMARVAGLAILSAWLLLAGSGRWRRPKGWREGLGLAVGGLWLAALAWIVVLLPLAQL
jgi:hypothetical protein